MMKTNILLLLFMVLISSCAINRRPASTKKFALQQVQKDYDLFRNIIETTHPGLYWYTPKDSMDFFFTKGRTMLQDSMSESQFRLALSYVVSKLGCGHTSIRPSKKFTRSGDSLRNRQFPLAFKIWKDTALVTFNLNSKDSIIKRGSVVTAIDGRPMPEIVDSLFKFLSTDGYNRTHKYQTLSNRGTFGALYLSVFGYRPKFNINFIDSTGKAAMAGVSIYSPAPDTTEPRAGTELPEVHRVPRRVRKKWELFSTRNITFDTSLSTAFMSLNTFQKSGKLRRFFRKSFRKSESLKIKNLVIDLRTNGGGNVTNSNLLTKYIADRPFKIADSLYTRNRSSQYSRYQQNHLGNWLFALFLTRKRADGNYHFGYYERKHFKPKRKNHFNGQVYVLSGGNTFSASTLFIKSVGQQKNVVVVGEETGGGAYGNNAWLIPNVTLPVTKVRFRLPLYRLVIDKNETKGFGVQPGVEAPPTVEAIKKNLDFKMNKAVELIRSNRQ